MKKICNLIAAAMLLGATMPGYAQNLNKHIDNAENASIDFLTSINGYLLAGTTHPAQVGGMDNSANWPGNLGRIQLQVLDDKLNTLGAKTYAVVDEVMAVKDGKCPRLSNHFLVGDAKETKDGGAIVCGSVRRDPETSGCGILGNYDHMFMLKVDNKGAVQWFKRYDRYGMLNSVVETPNGEFIACGRLGGAGLGTGLIIYTDAGGNVQWSKEALTPAYWDHDIYSNGSEYYEVINYKGNFALVGIANYVGTIWAGTLITVVDAAGSYIQNSVIDNQIFGYVLSGRAIADADDGDVVITGMAGTPCQTGAHVFILKIEPTAMNVNFLRVYSNNNYGDASMGSSIAVENNKRILVTGTDWVTNGGGGIYLETDYAGNLNRYTVFNYADASWGKGIVYNWMTGTPAYSGHYWPGSEPTFVIKNDQNKDCAHDIYMPDYTTPYEVYKSNDRDPNVKHVDDYAMEFDWNPKESIVCGQALVAAKNGTTGINDVAKENMKLTPNPANDYVDISIDNAAFAGSTVTVYDIAGRIMLSTTLKGGSATRINTAALQPGMYMLQAGLADGSSYRANFIKQ